MKKKFPSNCKSLFFSFLSPWMYFLWPEVLILFFNLGITNGLTFPSITSYQFIPLKNGCFFISSAPPCVPILFSTLRLSSFLKRSLHVSEKCFGNYNVAHWIFSNSYFRSLQKNGTCPDILPLSWKWAIIRWTRLVVKG